MSMRMSVWVSASTSNFNY